MYMRPSSRSDALALSPCTADEPVERETPPDAPAHAHRLPEDELRPRYARVEAAFNNTNQGLCMFDSSLHLTVCNARFLQMYGLSHLNLGLVSFEIVNI